jgi:glycosyltransferase involved in cell wall biosynthesis
VLRFCASVNEIIAPSTYIKNYLLTQDVKTPINIIPSPLREIFTETHVVKKQQNPFFELLLVTRFVPEKNIPFVFEVMKLLPDNYRLTLAGYGNDYEKLQKLAYDVFKFCPSRVQFIHKPDEKQLLQLYRTVDLFIFPSKTDTQGIVLAESMSQGVPVIAIDGPGQQDIIVDGVNGFIIKDAADAAEKITAIADDQALHNRLIVGAQKTAQKYHADCAVKQLLTVYKTFVNPLLHQAVHH